MQHDQQPFKKGFCVFYDPYLTTVKDTFRYFGYGLYTPGFPTLYCEYASPNASDLVNVLAAVWRPFCVIGKIQARRLDNVVRSAQLFKSSTLTTLNSLPQPSRPHLAEEQIL